MNNVIDFKAMKMWKAIPNEFQERILNSVFCLKCGNTTIINYKIVDGEHGIVLNGECNQCSGKVARVVEHE